MQIIPIPFSIQTLGLPVIPVKLFNETNSSLLLVDTGSDRSIMDIAVYNHLKIKSPTPNKAKISSQPMDKLHPP